MKFFVQLLALIIAVTYAAPQTVYAASSTPSFTSGFTVVKRRASVKRKKVRRKRLTKRQRAWAKSRRKARLAASKRRARLARAKRAKAKRAAAAKRAALYARTPNTRYRTREKRGTIIIETKTRHLYYVTGRNRATRYGVAVGKEGFAWSGTSKIRRKVKWPIWTPPAEMIARSPKYAKWKNGQPGGPKNPLGAAALYLFQGKVDTLYRIHGTNAPGSIGRAASSGCIRMRNEDIQHLYSRVKNGTKVIVR